MATSLSVVTAWNPGAAVAVGEAVGSIVHVGVGAEVLVAERVVTDAAEVHALKMQATRTTTKASMAIGVEYRCSGAFRMSISEEEVYASMAQQEGHLRAMMHPNIVPPTTSD
jgi:hypothetical protein